MTCEHYIDSGGSTIFNWDKYSSNSIYFGIKHSGAWQSWLSSSNSSWSSSSDARLKNVMGTIEGDMCQRLKAVQPVYFNFRSDASKRKRVGLIAQEIQAICPEVVSTDPEGHLGMAYGDAVPLLIAGIKELTARVEALEARPR